MYEHISCTSCASQFHSLTMTLWVTLAVLASPSCSSGQPCIGHWLDWGWSVEGDGRSVCLSRTRLRHFHCTYQAGLLFSSWIPQQLARLAGLRTQLPRRPNPSPPLNLYSIHTYIRTYVQSPSTCLDYHPLCCLLRSLNQLLISRTLIN